MQALQTGLSHIQEVRRRLRDSSHNPRQLPQLSWAIPRPPHPPSSRGSAREEASSAPERRIQRDAAEGESLGEEQQRWRLIGGELRMVADQFQLNRSKVSMNVTCSHIPVLNSFLVLHVIPMRSPSFPQRSGSVRVGARVGGRKGRVHVTVTPCG